MGIEGEKALPPRDEIWMLQEREADVKEYFFGDAKMVLSPSTQLVDFETLTIYKIPESESPLPHSCSPRSGQAGKYTPKAHQS